MLFTYLGFLDTRLTLSSSLFPIPLVLRYRVYLWVKVLLNLIFGFPGCYLPRWGLVDHIIKKPTSDCIRHNFVYRKENTSLVDKRMWIEAFTQYGIYYDCHSSVVKVQSTREYIAAITNLMDMKYNIYWSKFSDTAL